jgi:hypothetical protein
MAASVGAHMDRGVPVVAMKGDGFRRDHAGDSLSAPSG